MAESHDEQIARVEKMARGETLRWDFDDEDLDALRTVLKERRQLIMLMNIQDATNLPALLDSLIHIP